MDILTAVLAVFSSIGTWIVTQINSLVALFWTVGAGGEGELTILGVLAVISVGIATIFLCIRVIQNFLKFRS